jgi:DNA-directed RNA polymerase III subunit RPC3
MVELRNQKLTDLVADRIGITTSRVYATLLHLVSQAIGRCRSDDVLEMMGQNGDLGLEQEGVSTSDILNHLDVSVDLSCGIGKATSASIDRRLAESLQPRRLGHSAGHDEAQVLGDASSDEASGSDTSGASDDEIVQRPPLNGAHPKTKLNGIARVSTDSSTLSTGREGRLNQLRQHLLLLCEGQHIFVRHSSDDEWTVDFRPLLRRFQDAELDIVIEETSGRYGLRLAHILRKNGKLDEKNLPHIALMKKAAVQNKMLEMQMAGFVDIQEIPRDNNRTANRTMFLWFTDSERCLDQLLENTYKSMLRTLQILQVQRKQDREVLGLAERQDVRGREEEIMQATTYMAFIQHKEIEGKLLNQIMRLDDLVAVLRDF